MLPPLTPDAPGSCQSPLSDEQLVQRGAAGDRNAAEELFRRYRQFACRVAHRHLRNQADAEDAVQEALIKAFAHLPRFQGRSSFKTWLLRIVANAALNLGRQRDRCGRLRKRLKEDEDYSATRCAAEQRTPLHDLVEREEEERAKALENTMSRLVDANATPRMRRIFLKRLAGWSFRKIAKELGCPEREAWADMRCLWALVLSEETDVSRVTASPASSQRQNP